MSLRNVFYRLFIGEIVEDYGVFATDNFYGYQELRLLKCKKRGEEFFVLEGTTKIRYLLGFDTRFFKISEEGLLKLNNLLNTRVLNK